MSTRAEKKNARREKRKNRQSQKTVENQVIETTEVPQGSLKRAFFACAHVLGALFVWLIVTSLVITIGLNFIDAAIQGRFGTSDSVLNLVVSAGTVSAVFAYSLWFFKDAYRLIGWCASTGFPRLMKVFEKASESRENFKTMKDNDRVSDQ